MSKKTFVILTNIPTPYRTAFFNVLNQVLDSRGINFHVLYCARTEPRRYWAFVPEENNYEYTFLKGFHPTFKGIYPHFNVGVIRKISNLNPDWVLLAGSWNAPSVIQVLLNKSKLKIKTIFWSEGHVDAQKSTSKIINFVRGKIFKSIDSFVVPNKKSESYIRLYNKTAKIGFLPNTVDEEFFNADNLPSKLELREKYGYNVDERIVIYIGTINERKGSAELLEGYCLLNDEQKQKLRLIFVGTGDLMDKLIKEKETKNLSNVVFTGHASIEKVREYLQIADFFILPTKLDPNPLTPIESSFMKTPIILSRLAGNVGELVNPETGYVIQNIDPISINNSLVRVIDIDENNIEKMGVASYENVKSNFSRVASSESLINIISSL